MDNFLNTLSDMFYKNTRPQIIMDPFGNNCILNNEGEKTFGISVLDDIKELFPTIELDPNNNEQICKKAQSSTEYSFSITYYKENKQWVIELKDSHENEWDRFVTSQRMLHVLFLDLISISNEKEFFKALITKSRRILDIDRMGILLYDRENNKVKGSWGTDDNGKIIDQSDYSNTISEKDAYGDSLDLKNFIVFSQDIDLYDKGIIVGQGWNTKSIFYAGHSPVGWICCDNLISRRSLPKWKKEVLVELSRMTGDFIFNLRLENHLKDKVEKKTIALNKTIIELKETQENLIQAEKMASLGALISGVAHEMNTPIGIALTGASHIEETTQEIINKITESKLKKKDLDQFLNNSLYSSTLTVNSLKKASELVNIFKQLSVDQENNTVETTNLLTLINNILLTLKYSKELSGVNINLNIDKNLHIICNPGNFYQIFNNLIKNSLVHGFIDIANPEISITSSVHEGFVYIDYMDNGTGIPKKYYKKVFEPFYTTKRSQGSTGLGLSIIYNCVLKAKGRIKLVDDTECGIHFNIKLKE